MTTATGAPSAPTIGLSADQFNQLRRAIQNVAKHLKHHDHAAQSLSAWIKRQHGGLRKLHELPYDRLPVVLEQLNSLTERALRHSVELWSLEQAFLQQALGVAWADEERLQLEISEG